MKFEIGMAGAQIGEFGRGFLHPVFAEYRLAGGDGGHHSLFRFTFTDGGELDRSRFARGGACGGGDPVSGCFEVISNIIHWFNTLKQNEP